VLSKDLAAIKRDVAVATEMVSLFVRYYLTITPPLAASEHHAARTLGKERFQTFVTQIGRRLASDQRLVTDVLESIAANDPDLFVVARDDALPKVRPTNASAAKPTDDPVGQCPAVPPSEVRHG
jgi:hypothetical protein